MGTYRPNPRGMAELRGGRAMGAAMRRIAENVGVPAFRAAAPSYSGEYANRIGVEDYRGDRGDAGAALVLYPDADSDPNAPVSITFGTEDTPEHRGGLQAAIDAMERGRG